MKGSNYAACQWWKEAVVYQIYPASFKDSNNDGWGDLPGIISKLDYLKALGVDIVWLSPIYKSPQADMGYDIADYEDIDSRYGSLQDVEHLIEELSARDMKLMMDLVVNHTSDHHEWFKQSRSSKDPSNSKRDWYHWQPAKYDADGNRRPPNNWMQQLKDGNNAWTWDEGSQEYYLSIFTPEQPDLNWENPEVRNAVHNVLRFWLDKGVAGFRMDVINLISKVPGYPDAPIVNDKKEWQSGHMYFANGPRMHEYLKGIHEVLSEYNTITVGEMPYVDDIEEILKIVQPDRKELNMIFIFDLVTLDLAPPESRRNTQVFKKSRIREVTAKWQKTMMDRDGWNSLYIENHDCPRSVSRFTDDSDAPSEGFGTIRELGAKLLALMMTTLSGTLFVYQGQELGMKNVPSTWAIEEYLDVLSQTYYYKTKQRYAGSPELDEVMRECKEDLHRRARDNCRTPVQWTSEMPNAGFCGKDLKPWMRVNEDIQICNAEAQVDDKNSVLESWKEALLLRKEYASVFVYGDFELVGDGQDDKENPVFAYRRWTDTEEFVIVLNFSGQSREWIIPDSLRPRGWKSTNYERNPLDQEQQEKLILRPWEAILGMKQA